MKKKNFNIKDRCARCRSILVITDKNAGEIVCQNCGYVITEKMLADGPEWRSLQNGKSSSRVGTPLSILRHDLSTIINPANRDSLGNPLSTSTSMSLNRLRVWDNRSKISENNDRSLLKAFSQLQIMKDKLSLPDAVAEKAAYIYKKAIERKLARGRSINALVGASLYAACRDSETPRTLRDIMKTGNIKYKDLSKNYRILVKELDLKLPVAKSEQCVSRIASKAGISEKIMRQARDIIKKAERKKIASGKHPMGLAAAALYFACVKNDDKTSQKEIAAAAEVSEVTIRNRLRGLKPVTQV